MRWFDRGMVLLCVYAVTLPLTVTLTVNRAHWGDFIKWLVSDAGAGWFQAVGSVVSILISGWLVARQINANRELEFERRVADFKYKTNMALHSIDYHAKAAATLCLKVPDRFRNNKIATKALSEQMQFHRNAINQIDPGIIPIGIKEHHYGCSLTLNVIITWCDNAHYDEGSYDQFLITLKDCAEKLEQARSAIHSYSSSCESSG